MATEPERLTAISRPATLVVARVAALGLLSWGVYSEVAGDTTAARVAAGVLGLALVPALLAWSPAGSEGSGRLRSLVGLAWLGLAGGALAGLAPLALVLVGMAAMGASAGLELPVAIGMSLLGPAALLVAVELNGNSPDLIVGGLAAALAGLVLGIGRRQSYERTRQAVRVAVEHDRAEVERERAVVLAERNRLAREVHDVLAHTLGALSVQLEALDAQLSGVPAVPDVLREGVRNTRALASEGLDEARRAVHALRDDAVPLEEQLRRACRQPGVELSTSGDPRRLGPEVTFAVFRVAREALTNAAKHAPGADVFVRLDYGPGTVTLSVCNGAPRRPVGELARSGAGCGLVGIGERVRLLGGEVTAGPPGDGWLVRASVPA